VASQQLMHGQPLCCCCLQALPGAKQFLARFMEHLQQWLVDNSPIQMLKEQDIKVVLHEEVSQQQNDIDCGMFTIGYAVAAALNK
jgi:Ulp1 family protease